MRTSRSLLLGAIALLVALVWHTADRGPARSQELRDGVSDIDSRVALRPWRACEPRVSRFEWLAVGRAPKLDAEARFVWFEGPGPDARRQVHRIERATKRLVCLTCGEPGNNRRPEPHPSARAVLFDTDRFASWWRPIDRELMVLATDGGPARPAKRLTWDAARDTHALYDPSGLGVAWSRRTLVGRTLRAPIKLGHGSLSLGRSIVLARGGFAAVAPRAWSPDGRAFVLGGGFGFERWVAVEDFATGESRALPAASAFPGSVAFSADGALLARAERVGGQTAMWLGPAAGPGARVELGDIAAWGEPTGVALSAEAGAFALGQRRRGEERVVWAELACSRGAATAE